MVEFPSINKRVDDAWLFGVASVYIDPAHVIAVEPKQHSWDSFRPSQEYATIHLSTGVSIDVFTSTATVRESIEQALGLEIRPKE